MGFARPNKIFTAHESIVSGHAGVLTTTVHHSLVEAVIGVLQRSLFT